MAGPKRAIPQAGGALLALAILVGTLAGIWLGQPSIGLLAGLGAGILIAALLWLRDR